MEKDNLRSTGLVGLDLALGGGIPRGTVIIVAGTPTDGLDLFGAQFWRGEEEEESEPNGSYLMIDDEPSEKMYDARAVTNQNLPSLVLGERVVLDSLSTIILRDGIDAALDLIRELKKKTQAEDSNVILLLYKGIHTREEEIRLTRAADGYIELLQRITGSEVERMLGIFKMHGLDLPNQLVPYNILADGLELSTTKRVV
ncbi:RAD55 family ATPase [Methanofollis formosanus]|uniref:RAD55 family ATPase n=1 Tax=Methanofollis formosanus TaxID=299308 RepID=UPI001FEAAF96|nr:ATPase domain-containing protein [Methanofollis formosanus]